MTTSQRCALCKEEYKRPNIRKMELIDDYACIYCVNLLVLSKLTQLMDAKK